MGLTKTEEFTKAQNDLATVAKALGHPARIAIIQYLIKTKSCFCGDIVDELPLSQSTVSQHLNELKKAGLIKGDIEGPSVCYCIDEKAWNRASKAIGNLFESYKDANCC
jgi:DNA-binding transcriptional ArsR family regulator